ncbi:S1 family peptidase [Lentzea alba]|uniref:hypothetical protein n=1 Tax=Lentzea alba TaxID=2714351 RepID=UPI0039BF2254
MKMVKLSALAAVTAAALAASITPASAQGNVSITPDMQKLMATQQQLHKIAEKVERGSGFSGVYLDAGTRTLNVYWKGTAPAKVRTEAIAAKAKGLNVKVQLAKYSQAELKAEAARLAGANQSITGVAAKYDGSGLEVTQGTSSISLRAGTGIQSSVPVDVRVADVEPAQSRYADNAPWKGGGYIQNSGGGSCTSGFAVTTSTGAEKILTAAHCGAAGSTFSSSNGNTLGTVEGRSVAWDTELLSNPSGTTVAQTWIGESIQPELNGGTAVQYGLPVVAAARTFPGEWLCTSGAFSGTVCEIRAEQVGMSISLIGFGTVRDVVRAVHTGGGAAGGNGDSGGPVVSAVDQRLTARGTLTAIQTGAEVRPCYGVPAGNGRTCSRTIYFPDIFPQMEFHNVSIKTTS